MIHSRSAPAWAVELVTAACGEAGVTTPGRLIWRLRRAVASTGVTRHHERAISVRAGSDEIDQRLTLLHELAHWIGPAPRRTRARATHHGPAFYRMAFELYARHGVATADALAGEAARYPSALRHAAALGVRGAAEALVSRRARLRSRPRHRWRVIVPEHPIRLERDGRWTVCATCRQRIVGRNLARLRRARRVARHVLFAREELAS
jgi:hypothetical protein